MNENFEKHLSEIKVAESQLRRQVLRKVGNREDTEDIMQETLLRTYQKSSELKAPIGPWISKVAHNLALNQCEKTKREKCISIDSLLENDAIDKIFRSYDISPISEVLNKERWELLNTLLQQLPTDNRHLIVLHYIHGLKYTEIAKRLGRSDNAVRSKVRRTVKTLQDMLKKSAYLDENT